MNKPRHTRPSSKATSRSKTAKPAAAMPAAPVAAVPMPPKVSPDQTAAFLREVDEAMRVEKVQTLWRQWRWPLFGAVGAAMLAVAGWQAYGAWQAHADRTTAAHWDDLLRETELSTLNQALPAFVAESRYGYRALGLLAQASAATTPAEKLTAYRTLADDTQQPDWLRALGQLNAAMVLLTTNPAEGQAQLELLAQTEIGTPPLPTVALALELLALQAMQKNDRVTALAYTQRLLGLPEQGGALTPAMRTRALQRLGALQ